MVDCRKCVHFDGGSPTGPCVDCVVVRIKTGMLGYFKSDGSGGVD